MRRSFYATFHATLRPGFREVGTLLRKMDRLVLRFRKTPAGTRFADAWTAARIIRDLATTSAVGGTPEPVPAAG